jgi:hypothetical protein
MSRAQLRRDDRILIVGPGGNPALLRYFCGSAEGDLRPSLRVAKLRPGEVPVSRNDIGEAPSPILRMSLKRAFRRAILR